MVRNNEQPPEINPVTSLMHHSCSSLIRLQHCVLRESSTQEPRFASYSTLTLDLLPENVRRDYVVEERHHACATLSTDFPKEWDDLMAALSQLRLPKSEILTPGGGKSPIAKGLDGFFFKQGWQKHRFKIEVTVDGTVTLSPTHEVDYFRNRVAVEVEWNNKDPFYDRDLTTFRLLFELNVLSVGVIITRSDELQNIFDSVGKGGSYGPSTTHMSKLIPRIHNRASGGCPVLAFGMKPSLYDENR